MHIVKKINELKEKRNAIILAHNYQIPEIQELADYVGDSLELATQASKTNADVIVFCGVDFMVENAVILNPGKIVVHPDRDACCPMAAMVDIEKLKQLKREYPDAAVVSYVNTNAETKSLSDICCTSGNAVNVVESLPNKKIIFLPDKNLATYVQSKVSEKEVIPWKGYCYVHQDIIEKNILLEMKKEHPKAEILAHPECPLDVIKIADHVFSTYGMVQHVLNADTNEFIIGTERELCYRLRKENPDKKIYSIDNAICRAMKMITMEKLEKSLEKLEPRATIPEELVERAKTPLKRMMDVGRD